MTENPTRLSRSAHQPGHGMIQDWRRLAVPIACVMSLVLMFVAGCEPSQPKPPESTPQGGSLATGRPECPHSWNDYFHTKTGLFPPSGDLAISGSNTAVAEYHDCQRFLVPGTNAQGNRALVFDSLQAIFARANLDALYQDSTAGAVSVQNPGAFLQAAARDSMVVANPRSRFIAGLGPPARGGALTTPIRIRSLTIAVVYSEGEYAKLGLRSPSGKYPAFNCLLLTWDNAKPVRYVAWMVPVDKEAACLDARTLGFAAATQLVVDEVRPNPKFADVPPVARWDWDNSDTVQYIGIKCPTGWCEVHRPGQFNPSTSYHASSDLTGRAKRIVEVKGWYDEQFVASTKGWKSGRDGALATVFPDPDIVGRTMDNYRSTKSDSIWLRAAWINLTPASARYLNKANFGEFVPETMTGTTWRPGRLGKRTEISLCFAPAGRPDKCGIPVERMKVLVERKCVPDALNGGNWYAAVHREGESKDKYFCVTYRGMAGMQSPGVVRWRWQALDETIWISCPTGCCEMEMFCDDPAGCS